MERHHRSAAAIGQRRFIRPWMGDSVRFTATARILRTSALRRSEKLRPLHPAPHLRLIGHVLLPEGAF
jgi:hypothetical protein